MGIIIGRCVSRERALKTLEETKKQIPPDRVAAYQAALNRVRYEFRRHTPVAPDGDYCGHCGAELLEDATYCWNCGREIKR